MAPPDDDEALEAVEAAIDATDETTDRLWRHRLRGGTIAQVVAQYDETRTDVLRLRAPQAEYRIILRCARERGITPVQYLRQCLATSVVEEHGVDPATIPWMTRDGLLP